MPVYSCRFPFSHWRTQAPVSRSLTEVSISPGINARWDPSVLWTAIPPAMWSSPTADSMWWLISPVDSGPDLSPGSWLTNPCTRLSMTYFRFPRKSLMPALTSEPRSPTGNLGKLEYNFCLTNQYYFVSKRCWQKCQVFVTIKEQT